MVLKNIAVILAGGAGTRLGTTRPKQFLVMAGKTVIEHSVDAFECNKNIDEIAVVVHPSYTIDVESMIADNGWTKVKKIIPSGKERYNSSLAAINAYIEHDACNIIFHDAARPLVTQRIINDVVAALRQHNAVSVTLPAVDTIVETNPSQRYIRRIPKRKFLQHAQTPQGFRWQTIAAAYIKALQDPELEATDDCGIVLKYLPKEKIFIVSGDVRNIKLTYPEDIGMLTYLLKAANK